ncbi:MAG: NUDIX domain-containing protein [Clostridia bacterium]|nr:NUDIX domain-containing protein [Clostridia bacterium]
MDKYCIILIYNKDRSRLLMCHRTKEPYTGLMNFVGGRIEQGETEAEAAYREMSEETGITKKDITLHYLMSTKYLLMGFGLEIFAGRLKYDVEVYGEENPLCWVSADDNFFDTTRYAGDGNLGHILLIAEKNKDTLF